MDKIRVANPTHVGVILGSSGAILSFKYVLLILWGISIPMVSTRARL